MTDYATPKVLQNQRPAPKLYTTYCAGCQVQSVLTESPLYLTRFFWICRGCCK